MRTTARVRGGPPRPSDGRDRRAARRRRPARRVGHVVVITWLVAALAGMPAAAQDGAGDPAGTGDQGASLTITASTLYVSPTTDAIPPTLRRQVPPEAVCVLRPELCPQATEPLRQAIVGGLRQINENEPAAPVQPVPPDTAAVSFLGGQTRYQTAVQFDLPAVPAGEEVVAFTVTLPQSQPSYEVGSPAFRRAVLAAFETVGPQDPAVLAEGLAAALQEDPVEVDPGLIGVEACPLLSAFTPGGAPQASPDDDLPRRSDGDADEVDVDCIFGANGVRTESGDWAFDLTFTAAAWLSGEIDNHGLLLRPIGAPNLAFGDPDTSTSAQVALDLTEARGDLQTAPAAPPLEGLPPDGFEDPVVADGEDPFGDDVAGDGFADAGDFDSGGFDEVDGGGGGMADAPAFDDAEVADGGALDAEVAAGAAAGAATGASTLAADEAGVAGQWWLWLLIPVFLGGAYALSQALVPGGVALTGTGSGALSRLVARRVGGSSRS